MVSAPRDAPLSGVAHFPSLEEAGASSLVATEPWGRGARNVLIEILILWLILTYNYFIAAGVVRVVLSAYVPFVVDGRALAQCDAPAGIIIL